MDSAGYDVYFSLTAILDHSVAVRQFNGSLLRILNTKRARKNPSEYRERLQKTRIYTTGALYNRAPGVQNVNQVRFIGNIITMPGV